jgi:hypothetical protein
MKFTFSVKKKTLSEYPLIKNLDKIFEGHVKCHLPDECGVLTASNRNHFPGLQLLLYSLKKGYEVPVHVVDLGMTKVQLEWVVAWGASVSSKYVPPFAPIHYWEAWAKPFYVKSSPFKKTLWIDCDTIVVGELLDIVDCGILKPVFTLDYSGETTYNRPELYTLLPIDGVLEDTGARLNTGVFFVDLERDRELIDTWSDVVMKACEDWNIQTAVTCWDQGCCKWALQKLKLDVILDDITFNYPASSRQYAFPDSKVAFDFFLTTIKSAIDEGVVVFHWMGSPKPWEMWPEILPL